MRPSFFLIIVFFSCSISASIAYPQVPKEIGGFTLGDQFKERPEFEYTDYLKEIVVRDSNGFKKIKLFYGTCAFPNEIIRISAKYEKSSKQFYEELLKIYKERFGLNAKWKGDAFKISHTWKWVFKDDQQRRVNLILQHNLLDLDENIGNVVKLSYPDRLDEEHKCFIEQLRSQKKQENKELINKLPVKMEWDHMIPK